MQTTRSAHVSFTAGRAVIIETDGSWWTLEIDRDCMAVRGPERAEANLRLEAYLQNRDPTVMNPGEPPYAVVQARMLLEYQLGAAVLQWCSALDPRNTMGVREAMAARLETRLADTKVFDRFLGLVVTEGLPPEASPHDAPFTGRAAEALTLALARTPTP